jgi:hypothetical protein
MGVFIIHPCLPSCRSSCTTAGPLRSTGITPLHCYCWPLRHPLAVHRFPGVAGYTVFCSLVFLHGTRRASPVAQCVLVIVPSLSPRQSVSPPQSVCSDPYCLHPRTVSSAPGFKVFEVTYAFTFVTARRLAHHPMDGFVDRLHALRFLRACDPSYKALTFTLVGLSPTGCIGLLLDILFGSFLPSLWSLSNQSLLGSRSRHCYAIKWFLAGLLVRFPR